MKNTRVSISSDNLRYLESIAQQWETNSLSQALNYLLFSLRTNTTVSVPHPTATTATATNETPYVQIPMQEMYVESLPKDPVIERFVALGLDEF
ncbi:MAG: hypothetical protein SAK29_01285 [Scytonema sp. PMC 1069.18]|nr:hypothetical protein [Scytonema sp. PMC 1069.18]MEC4811908.1 hypothetical protein [Scytonema sp. PMC 1069.18]MEC4884989.1 hypothetical protein [Scytonema sp. PMC 1070.18]